VVLGDGCRVSRVDLGDGAEVQQFAEQFSAAMRDQLMDEPMARIELTRLVLEPIASSLEGIDRWLVVPDGSLWGTPIGVLLDPTDSNRYLLERVTVGYLTSTHELAEAVIEGSGAELLERSLLMGAPDFGSAESGGPVVLTDHGPCQLEPFQMLPATKREIEDIAPLISEPHLLMGAEVNKARLEEELANRPRVVHFATHAYFAGSGGCAQTVDGDGLREKPISPNPCSYRESC